MFRFRSTPAREYLEESFLWNMFSQVVLALDYCHGHQGRDGSRGAIVHRDLKPENVFLTEDNVVKVTSPHLGTWFGVLYRNKSEKQKIGCSTG